MYNPVSINKYGVYDIYYNDNNQYIIITNNNHMLNIRFIINNNIETFKFYTKKIEYNAHPHIYTFEHPIYYSSIKLLINDEEIDVSVNKYPSQTNKIIMSTMVRFEDAYIIQWIKYNKLLGIEHFVIYDNAKNPLHYYGREFSNIVTTDLQTVLKDYIDDGSVTLIDWPFSSDPHLRNRQQEAHENHCINAFRNAKYIGFFDIDEYINIQVDDINISNLLDTILLHNNKSYNDIGAIAILTKDFKNPNSLLENDFNFLDIYTCCEDVYRIVYAENYIASQKCFIIPKNVIMFQVHFIQDGLSTIIIDNTNIVYTNHYIFLNKITRGRDLGQTLVFDDSIKKMKNLLV